MDVAVPAVELRKVTLRYGSAARPVVDHISLTVPRGGMLTILGPNGVGKSTLLKAIVGIVRPEAGDVLIAGAPLATLAPTERARSLALVSQSETSAFALSVEQTVLTGRAASMGMFGRPGATDREIAARALTRLGIADLAQRSLAELSGGQRQLVRIARALAQQAMVLILDEPTAHLDLANQMQVLRAITQLRAEGQTVIATSHDPAHAFVCGGDALLLGGNGVWQCGPATTIMDAQSLSQLYAVSVMLIQTPSGPIVLPDYAPLTMVGF